MAAINISTGKIIGCEENSLKWFHEKGHLVYNNSIGIRIGIWQKNIFYFMICFIVLTPLFKLWPKLFCVIGGIVFFMIYLLIEIFEEIWCWRFAFKNRKEKDI